MKLHYAQAMAEQIGREVKRFHFEPKVQAMDDYPNFQDIPNESVVIFVCATTGQGDQPDNMTKFWRSLLKRTLPKVFPKLFIPSMFYKHSN